MNSKERVNLTVNYIEPDRVPVYASYVPEEASKLKAYFRNDDFDEVLLELGNDMVQLGYGFLNGYYLKEDDEYYDDWGCKWKYFENASGRYSEIIEHPLEDKTRLDSYKIPDPEEPGQYEHGRQIIQKYGRDYWIFACIACSMFESSFGLRGLDNLLMDMVEDKDFVHALFDKVMQYPLVAGRKLIEMGIDMLWTGDDVGTQRGLIMSPETWREFMKPRFAKLFSEFRKLNPNVKIAYHSCGNCEAILDEMVEIGLDIINPIQPACMNPEYIKKRYGKKLVLWGGVDIQNLLPFGTKAEIDAYVKKLIADCGVGGGFIISPAHNVQGDTSIENILQFYKAAREFGRYPIK
jgi:uroporphyrinogen decarboxylase